VSFQGLIVVRLVSSVQKPESILRCTHANRDLSIWRNPAIVCSDGDTSLKDNGSGVQVSPDILFFGDGMALCLVMARGAMDGE